MNGKVIQSDVLEKVDIVKIIWITANYPNFHIIMMDRNRQTVFSHFWISIPKSIEILVRPLTMDMDHAFICVRNFPFNRFNCFTYFDLFAHQNVTFGIDNNN